MSVKKKIKEIEESAKGDYKNFPCSCSSEVNIAKKALAVIRELEKEIKQLNKGCND